MKAKTLQIEEKNKCPECKSKDLNRDSYRAEVVCNNCGLVLDQNLIDYTPEWRAYNKEEKDKKARTGAPMSPLLYDKGLSTTIGWKNRDSYGQKIPTRNRASLYRLRKWQKRIRFQDGIHRSLSIALKSLDRMSSALNLPRIARENAAVIYRKAARETLIRGRSIDALVAAAIYTSCRQCNLPRTLNEISKKVDIPKKTIGRCYRHLSRELKLKLLPTSPKDYIPRYANQLKLRGETKEKAIEIIDEAAEKKLFSGRGPINIASAALYMAAFLCNDRRTQKQISELTGVTEVTIRNRYKELSEELGIEIDT